MMNFIKNIAENKVDEFTHHCFVRYGVGDYEKEPLKIQKTRNSIRMGGGFEYVTAFHRFMATVVKDKVHLIGNIITSRDIEKDINEIEIKDKKPQRGKAGYQYEIDTEITPSQYLNLTRKCYDCFLLMHMNSGIRSISVKKTKPPKLTKVIENFVRLVIDLEDFDKLKEEFLFDVDAEDFKKIEIRHIYHITDIKLPKEDDPALMRLKAKRIGKVERIIDIDGKIIKKEYPMEV